MSLYGKRYYSDSDSDSDYDSDTIRVSSDSDYDSDYYSDYDSDGSRTNRNYRITAAEMRDIMKEVRARINGDTLRDIFKHSGHRSEQIRLPGDFRAKTREEIYKSLSSKKPEIDFGIHKQVLDHLKELAEKRDLNEINEVADMIKRHPFALQHVKDYPSQYRKVLGEYFIDFEKHF
jgi:hypothetical protein